MSRIARGNLAASIEDPPKGPRRATGAAMLVRGVHFGVPTACAVAALTWGTYTVLGVLHRSISPGSEIFRSPWLGGIAALTEDYLPRILMLWAIAGALLSHASRRRRHAAFARLTLRSEIDLRRWLKRFGLVACTCLFLFSLTRSWAETAPRRGGESARYDSTPYSSLLGAIPWSDAYGYYSGARRLLDTGRLDYWNERRPLNATWLAVRLGVTGLDLRAATVLQVLLLAFCAYLAGSTLARDLGPWTGVATTALILAFGRWYDATTLSESLGLSLGALSLNLLYRGVVEKRGAFAAAGLGALSLGMGARAGALFAVPCILLALFAGAWVFGAHRLKPAAAAVLLAFVGIAWTPLLNRVYGSGAGMAGANFSYTAAGLAMGGGWLDAQERYADELAKLASERQKATFLYGRAFALVRRDPRPFLKSLLDGERIFLRDIGPMLSGLALFGAKPVEDLEWIFLALGILFTLRRRRHDGLLWLGTWAGLLLSVPFIFRDGGWRSLATTWPLLSGFLAIGVAVEWPPFVEKVRSRRRWSLSTDAAWLCVVALAICPLLGPLTFRATTASPHLRQCVMDTQGGTLIVTRRIATEPVAQVVESKPPHAARVPVLTYPVYLQRVQESSNEDRSALLRLPARSFLIFDTYDYAGHGVRQLIGPPDLLSVRSPWMWLKVERYTKYFQHVVDFGPWVACQPRPVTP